MPIKFRCSYCRQFLGISRAQAGGVVDCPTCGRSIRVPLLDGTVQPMAAPELDLEDTHLARALDELARLADAPIQNVAPTRSSQAEADDNETENQIPQPLPEPIPIEMPLPPTPVIVQPPTNAALSTPSGNGATSEAGLLAELATLSAGLSSIDNRVEVDTSAAYRTPQVRTANRSPMMISVGVLVIFLTGMLTERFVRVFERLSQSKIVANEAAKNDVVDSELTGRITYKTKDGESQPDRGARVIIFPQQRSGEVKLPVIGFRPADAPADQLVANAALQALGGSAASVDERGIFRLSIGAGTYRVLVISHFQPRDDSAPDPELSKFLSAYFEKPDDLLGRVQHEFAPLRIKGTGDIWDHSF